MTERKKAMGRGGRRVGEGREGEKGKEGGGKGGWVGKVMMMRAGCLWVVVGWGGGGDR